MDLTIKNTTDCLRTLMNFPTDVILEAASPGHIGFYGKTYPWLLMKLTHYIEENLKLPSTKDIHRWQKQAVKKFSTTF